MEEEGKGGIREGRGREGNDNWDHPPTIFGLEVALPILIQYFRQNLPCARHPLALPTVTESSVRNGNDSKISSF